MRTAARRALVALLLVAALLTAQAATEAATEQAVLRAATADRTSLVLVSACAPGGVTECRSSTAFSVGPGLFVTASHSLLGSSQVILFSALHGSVPATVERVAGNDDLAVLRSSLLLPALRTAAAAAGETAAVICSRRAIAADGVDGSPANYVGHIGGAPIRVQDGDHQLLLERVAGAASVLGCSGSPVIDRDGAVTGVLLAGDGGSAGMVDARRLSPLLGGD
ncbi:MAG TPA: hypothetical protein VFC09_15965 [Candidatus Dormibacteraeota bacterium]|nr:hypothetical protein [Candidatus Dormibacteraeota bacterium]